MIEIVETGENFKKVKFLDTEATLLRQDPWGFWSFKWKSGEPPEILSGMFTDHNKAIEVLNNYIHSLPPTKKKAKE